MMQSSNPTVSLFTEAGILIKSRMQKALPLPFSQCQTLWFVAGKERVSMQEVAQHFKIQAPSATFLVEELVRGDLLSRHTNPKDRRKVEVTLTLKGKKTHKAMEEKRNEILGRIFGSLEGRDRAELNRILEKIISNA
jgi:DNA-binding MarR family transcriptional regulator